MYDECPDILSMVSALALAGSNSVLLRHCQICSACQLRRTGLLRAEAELASHARVIDCDEAEAIDPDGAPEQPAMLLAHLRTCTECRERMAIFLSADECSTQNCTVDLGGLGDRYALSASKCGDSLASGQPSSSFVRRPAGIMGYGMIEPTTLGNGRFRIIRRLGAGGMGVVYEAYDLKEKLTVALKTLRNPATLRRLKNEFRARADLEHPNLVAVKELFEEQGLWFFTMELVRGIDFISYVRPSMAGKTSRLADSLCDHERLRSVLQQLALGLRALHGSGKVHRDIKPSNILVTESGRLVLLDFGLMADLGASSSTARSIVGTPAYMAPEQAAARRVGPAADWYSVGVILYEALVDRVPFTGTRFELFMNKQWQRPARPRQLVPDVPEDLDALCMDLLEFSPERRPGAAEVLVRLGCAPTEEWPAAASRSSGHSSAMFVGRDRELDILCHAFHQARNGAGSTVLVHGESGVGKSSLVQHFERWLRDTGERVVRLVGRCYERESVPYKAFDNIIDALSIHLGQLSRRELNELMPRKARLLGQVFPILRGLEPIASAPEVRQSIVDPMELRAQVFAVLRELLARIADRQPLVLIIDDLQWADSDSLALLAEIMRPPDPPPLLLLATVRDTADGRPPEVIAEAIPGDVHAVSLGRLQPEQARELTSLLLQHNGVSGSGLAEALAEEADGHPLFIHELVRHVALGEVAHSRKLRLEDALWARVQALAPPARHLIELAAVAGTPLSQDTLSRAVDIGGEAFSQQVALLRVANLLRTARGSKPDYLEPYHDRVREAVLAKLGPEQLRQRHEQLAVALELDGHADPETLAAHWLGAGQPSRAHAYALEAAQRADETCAFDRATRLYRMAIELGDGELSPARSLWIKLGNALRNSGRGAAAARAFLSAAEDAPADEAIEYKRRAAENLLHAGHIDEGLEVLAEVMAAVGIDMPATPRQALISLLARRTRLRLRGLRFRERHETQVDRGDLTRIDICWSGGIGLCGADIFRSSDFQTRHLLLALDAGEPYRIARALALEAAQHAIFGIKRQRRAQEMLDTAAALARRLNAPDALGRVSSARGVCAYMCGEWKTAYEHSIEAEQILRNRCIGVPFELSVTQLFILGALFYLGELGELATRAARFVREADERANRYAETSFRTGLPNIRWLAAGDIDGARHARAEAMRLWSQGGFLMQHKEDLLARQHIELYAGCGRAAWDDIVRDWPALKRSLILKFQHSRVECLYARGRSALAAARDGGPHGELLSLAEQDARHLTSERLAYSVPMAQLLRAGAASMRARDQDAIAHLEQAETGFDTAGMSLYAAAARRMRGRLVGGDQGRQLIDAADAWMRGQQIRVPERMAAMLVPGFTE